MEISWPFLLTNSQPCGWEFLPIYSDDPDLIARFVIRLSLSTTLLCFHNLPDVHSFSILDPPFLTRTFSTNPHFGPHLVEWEEDQMKEEDSNTQTMSAIYSLHSTSRHLEYYIDK